MPVVKGLELFTDPITPDQFYDVWGVQAPDTATGGRRLMRAILEDAIHCIVDDIKLPSVVRKEALRWITNHDKEWIFSFRNICSELGLPAGRLRAGILENRKK